MRRLALIALCAVTALASANAPRLAGQDRARVDEVVESNNQFALKLYRELGRKPPTPEGNLFFSPFGVSTVLAMTYAGARGETERQMAAALGFSSNDDRLHSGFSGVLLALWAIQQKQQVQLSVASTLWPQDRYPFLPAYLQLARDYYGAEIEPVDFAGDPNAARDTINAWAERATNGRIQDFIPREHPPLPDTRLILANAIHFKGNWAAQFAESSTTEMPFHPSENRTVQVPMMRQTNAFQYWEDQAVQALELPYEGNDISLLIVLPRRIDGLVDVEGRMTVGDIRAWAAEGSWTRVAVTLPRFKITSAFELNEPLKALGLTDVFGDTANLSGMDGSDWLKVQTVWQKAFIEVNEEGTYAAALTGGCFPSGTPVLTEGGLRVIDSVEPGLKVYAFDLARGEWILARVLNRRSLEYEGELITVHAGPASLQATASQPFFVSRGGHLADRPVPREVSSGEQQPALQGRWVEARDLRAGDLLKTKSGEELVITDILSRREQLEVYSLDIEGHHNFAVLRQGVLVHNKGKKEGPPESIEFLADHPFLFLIRDTGTKSILFMGRFSHPPAE